MNQSVSTRTVLRLTLIALCVFFAAPATAAPEARLLRVDPRASTSSGHPTITTVIEVQQSRRISQATSKCASLTRGKRLACIAEALEKPLYSPFAFPGDNALFTVTVDGSDRPARLLSVEPWGKAQRQPGVGTAWLILVDADSRMGRSFADARELARKFVSAMGPNDIANVMYFNDRQVFSDSGWQAQARKSKLTSFISSVTKTMPRQGRTRPLLTIIRDAATDGFKALGNAGNSVKVPLHQAMVVLSSGYGGTDPSTTGPGAAQLSQYMTGGRFPENNTALPKTPVPVTSVYFPTKTWDEFANNALEFMLNLANPQIGGFFNVMQVGEAKSRASSIVRAVRTRFSKMYLAKWRVACLAPSTSQTFKLNFTDVNPPILGDSSFKDVPLGIDPRQWPLDVDSTRTQAGAGEGVHPGGTFRVYGDFCWGGQKNRAEVYFLPAGQPLPRELSSANPDQAKKAQQDLIAQGMRGEVVQAGDTFAEFRAPDNDKLIHGSGPQAVARLVLYDNVARRASGITADSVVQVKARTAPFPLPILLGALGGVLVLGLILTLALRSSGRRRRPATAAPSPPYAPSPAYAPSPSPAYAPPMGGGAPMAAPAPANPSKAVLRGAAGVFTILGPEVRAGRDAATCTVLLQEPAVSSHHASLKFEAGALYVRDENSNNGTYVAGARISSGQWIAVGHGVAVAFGPSQFSAQLEA